MKNLDPELFRSLLFSDLEIEVEGLRVQSLQVNQHLPTTQKVAAHQHDSDQLLLYLKGEGTQSFPDHQEEYAAQRGDFFVIPAGVRHGFRKRRKYPPLVLTITCTGSGLPFAGVQRLPPNAMKTVERSLLRLAQQPAPSSYAAAAEILRMVAALVEAAAPSKEATAPSKGSCEWQVLRLLKKTSTEAWSPRTVAQALDTEPNQLTRQLTQEGSPSVGQLIGRERLRIAQQQLRESPDRPVGEVATEVGLADQNYFCRWFKKQTGYSPSDWRERNSCL